MDTDTPALGEESTEHVLDTQETPDEQADVAKPSEDPESFTTVRFDELSEEGKAIYKQFQGDYTRKTQDIASTRGKADAFEKMVSNPGFAQMMDNIEKYGTPVAPKEEPAKETRLSGEDLLLRILEDPDFFYKEVDRIAESKVAPLSTREAAKEADAEISRLSSKYPDFMTYETEIANLIEESGHRIDAEKAYKIVTYDKALSRGMEEGSKTTEKRLNTPTSRSSAASAEAPVEYKSIHEAFEAAKKQLS